MLIIFSGLPGTGKTTIARALAKRRVAAYLRIDTIEHALAEAQGHQGDIGPAGYLIAYELAKSNLELGIPVIADSVNPLEITRQCWRDVAKSASAPFIEVEVVCSDLAEHEQRVNSRKTDISGFALPTWQQVMQREYEPWAKQRLIIDTSRSTSYEAAAMILEQWSTLTA